ncbi:hypothetical protein E2C01_097250 [Portunus trituberculatus]|uniref:Uncharacterized protein n=1 Tax=Portunus trituberculatus TaxID=210409 RepID=A0A5B7K408_PORTR|nr:hypothetical protein [Portunus trituberculatus]
MIHPHSQPQSRLPPSSLSLIAFIHKSLSHGRCLSPSLTHRPNEQPCLQSGYATPPLMKPLSRNLLMVTH